MLVSMILPLKVARINSNKPKHQRKQWSYIESSLYRAYDRGVTQPVGDGSQPVKLSLTRSVAPSEGGLTGARGIGEGKREEKCISLRRALVEPRKNTIHRPVALPKKKHTQ